MTPNDSRVDGARLPQEIRPPRDLWPGIDARIRQAGPPTRRRPHRWVALAAVAAALAIWALSPAPTPTPSTEVIALAEPAWQVAMEDATRQLATAFEAQRQELSPEVAAVVEENLRVIDVAMQECAAALAEQPHAAEIEQQLANHYRRKINLLADVQALTSTDRTRSAP